MSRRSWSSTYGWSFWLTLPLAGLFCAAVSVLIGLPILRLRGVYFAMVTLVLTEVARLLALALPITNGAKGMVSIPLPGAYRIFGLTIVPDLPRCRTRGSPSISLGGDRHGAVLCRRCTGWSIRASASCASRCSRTRSWPRRSASTSPDLRVIAYAISSFFGGVAGAIFVGHLAVGLPVELHLTDSVNFMLNCFLGGLGYVFGPMLGTLRPLLRLGPAVPDRAVPAADLFDADDRPDAGAAQRHTEPRLALPGRSG